MLYEYDEVGRVSKVTPPQGTNYRTQYTYKENGSVSQVKVYDAGSGADTDYTYSTTSGKLTQRNNPVVSAANVRTTYAYDSAGRHAGMLFAGASPVPPNTFSGGEKLASNHPANRWTLAGSGNTE